MVKTRRSLRVEKENPLDPSPVEKRRKQLVDAVAGIQRNGRNVEESLDLLIGLFEVTTRGQWFRILPVDDQYDDISHATGMEWRYLLPILMKVGLIATKVTSVVKDVHVVKRQWDELGAAIVKRVRLQTTVIRAKNQSRAYFFCIGDPIYHSPIEQYRHVKLPTISLPGHSREENEIRRRFKQKANAIIRRRLIGRINQEDALPQQEPFEEQQHNAEEMEEEEVMALGTVFENRISFALTLDLNHQPRLSRKSEGNV